MLYAAFGYSGRSSIPSDRRAMLSALRFAFRQLARSPGFTTAAVLTLALGIGFSVSCFSITNAFLLRDVPYPDPHQLVQIFQTSPQSQSLQHAPANLAALREASTSFQATAIFGGGFHTLGEPGQPPEPVSALSASPEFLDVLRVQPLLGRGFAVGEDESDRPRVALLSHRTWTRRYGSDPAVLGRTVRLNGIVHTIVGVLPPGFDAPLVWGPVEFLIPTLTTPAVKAVRHARWLWCIGRLKPGVTARAAEKDLATITARLVRDFPKENAGIGVRVAPLHNSNQSPTYRTMVWLATALALTMLLIACANLASLQMARALGRTHDYAVRAALGGTRWQLTLPLVLESLLLAVLGGAGGLLIAWWANDLIGRTLIVGLERGFHVPIDIRVLLFAGGVALLSGLAFGLVPGWFAARSSAAEALKDSSRAATPTRAQQRTKRILISSTLALALALVGVAGSFGFGFRGFLRRPLGWEPEGLFIGNFTLPNPRYSFSKPDGLRQFQRALLAGLAALPGVRHAALSTGLPLYSLDNVGRTTAVVVEGQPPPSPGQEPIVETQAVSSDYFAALGIRLRQGSFFPADYQSGDSPVCIVNQSLADRFWPNQDPLGRRLRFTAVNTLGAGEEWFQIIGVVDDVRMLRRLDAPATRLQLYRPLIQVPNRYLIVVVRAEQSPAAMVAPVRRAVAAVDADVVVALAGSVEARTAWFRVSTGLIIASLAISATLGLLIAAVGLFGIVSHFMIQRTREIGVRIALGAGSADVLRIVAAEARRLLVVGLAAGVPAYLALNQVLRRTMPEMALPGPWWLATNLIILAGVTLLACWLPARRATRINPVDALRAE